MVVAKRRRKSKRVSTSRLLKMKRKERMRLKRIRRRAKRSSKSFIKVPQSVFLSNDEKELLKEIRGRTKAKHAELTETGKTMVKKSLKNLVEECGIIIELVDACDPIESRSIDIEQIAAAVGKPIHVLYYNYEIVPPEVKERILIKDVRYICHPNIEDVDTTLASSALIALIKGMDKHGVASYLKSAGLEVETYEFEPASNLCGVFRGNKLITLTDSIKFTEELIPVLKRDSVLIRYNIPDFHDANDFLRLVGESLGISNRVDVFKTVVDDLKNEIVVCSDGTNVLFSQRAAS